MARKSFDKLTFILSAVSDDNARYFMHKAYFDKEGSCLVAIDGRRIHIWKMNDVLKELHGLTESTYVDIIPKIGKIIPCTMEWQFPNWRKVLPEYVQNKENVLDLEGKEAFNMHVSQWIAYNSIAINLAYMKDIIGASWLYSKHDTDPKNKAVQFDYDDCTAIIMPMHIN
jgi:hypothetical protein